MGMVLVLDKCFLFILLASFFKHLLYLSIRMKSCDLWLKQIREPLLDTRRYWLVYPHEKVTLLFVLCQKHTIPAPRLLTFSKYRFVKTIAEQLSCIIFVSYQSGYDGRSTLCPLSILKQGQT